MEQHHTTQPAEEGGAQHLLNHLATTLNGETAQRLHEGYQTHGAPFAAFLLLEDTNPDDPDITQTFTDVYAATYPDLDQLIDHELDALGWNYALTELCTAQGIHPEFLTWNRPLLTSYLTEIYSIIQLDGHHHVFYR